VDFDGEAPVMGAYCKTVTDPGKLEAVLGHVLDETREDQSGVVAVRLA